MNQQDSSHSFPWKKKPKTIQMIMSCQLDFHWKGHLSWWDKSVISVTGKAFAVVSTKEPLILSLNTAVCFINVCCSCPTLAPIVEAIGRKLICKCLYSFLSLGWVWQFIRNLVILEITCQAVLCNMGEGNSHALSQFLNVQRKACLSTVMWKTLWLGGAQR